MRQRHVLDAECHNGGEDRQEQQLADDIGRERRKPRERLKSSSRQQAHAAFSDELHGRKGQHVMEAGEL